MGTETPKTLGRYEILEEIGRGMMGVVYRALDPVLGRTVALKTVSLAFAFSGADQGSFEKRFLAEARVAAALAHPGIVVVHDIGRDPDGATLFIAFEFLEGKNLADLTQDGIPLDWREALRITARVAEALDHAHSQGVVHRDIKPANVMLQPSGEPKLMDFGIAKIPAAQLTGAGEMFGTPSYMSPEQAVGESIDGRSDIFSLGSVLYLMLTGRRAFDGPSVPTILARVTVHEPTAPGALHPHIPPDVDRIVARALAKSPDERYPNGRSLAEDLEDVLAGRPPRHFEATEALGRAERERVLAKGFEAKNRALDLDETEDISFNDRPGRRSVLARMRRRMRRPGRLAGAALLMSGVAIALGLRLAEIPPPAPHSPPSSAPVAVATATPEASPIPQSPTPSPTTAAEIAPSPTTAPASSVPPVVMARLEVAFDHSFKSASLRLLVDNTKVIDERLEAPVVKKIGPVHKRKAAFRKLVEIVPGTHTIRVDVQSEGFTSSRRIRGEFLAGGTRRLKIDKTGIPLVREDLALDWF